MKSNNSNFSTQPFSLSIYTLVVFALSYPFQIAYYFLGENYKPILLVSMIMAGAGAYICGKYIFKDGFKGAGWSWGKPLHYIYVFALALFLWYFPSFLERTIDIYVAPKNVNLDVAIKGFLWSIVFTILPAFGEEFSWRGYLLPRLFKKYQPQKALIVHGLITWLWHLPFIIIMGLESGGNPFQSVLLVLSVSFIPTIMHALVFAFIWMKSQSLAVSTAYHVFFDEIRDALIASVGLGVLGQNWQMLVLTFLGILFLWKVKWKNNLLK